MITRRTFLRVLGSAAVGAVLAPRIPIALPEAPTLTTYVTAPSPGALTLEMLEAAYKACAIGRREPSLMIMHASVARKLGLVYDVEIEDAA